MTPIALNFLKPAVVKLQSEREFLGVKVSAIKGENRSRPFHVAERLGLEIFIVSGCWFKTMHF